MHEMRNKQDVGMITEVVDPETRSTFEYWQRRVAQHGIFASNCLTHTPNEIAAFTAKHLPLLMRYAQGKEVLEVGCGWGRLAPMLDSIAASYVGVDFVPALIAQAEANNPDLEFQVQNARYLSFGNDRFDVVVGILTLSSFATNFEDILKELKRVLKPDGTILFLEDKYARIDWK